MKLGGPLFRAFSSPSEWVEACRAHGYSAAYCPVGVEASDGEVTAYRRAADEAGIVIAEVGAWSNPLSLDEEVREKAVAYCKGQLALAERIGARACVNIAGARSHNFHGPGKNDLCDEVFEMIVETTREIIDAVGPTCTCYALEMMPWAYPDTPDSYLRLLRAIDRPAFGVHLDPVNITSSPQKYFDNRALIRECFEKLGPHIRTCHAKDISLTDDLTVRLVEVRPGQGNLDYATFLRELDKLHPDTPILLEHLPDPGEYALAAEHIRKVARREGIALR
jgi:sugar phosphate isomerase/epimerase